MNCKVYSPSIQSNFRTWGPTSNGRLFTVRWFFFYSTRFCVLHVHVPDSTEDQNNDISIASLLSYLQSEEDVIERELKTSEEELFTPWVIRRQLAMFAAENQQQSAADRRSTQVVARKWNQIPHTSSSCSQVSLAIHATSAPSERVFSVAGGVCKRRRASLSPQQVAPLVAAAYSPVLVWF